MKLAIYKNDKWIGNILVRKGRIMASGSVGVIYNLLLDMKTIKPQTNIDLIKNLPTLLHDNSSEFKAVITDKTEPAKQVKPVKPNAQTINSPEDKVQDLYLSPRRYW